MSGTEGLVGRDGVPSTSEAVARRELMVNAARQFDEAGRRFRAEDAENNALLVIPLDGRRDIGDLQTFLPRLVDGVVCTNLRLAKEILLADGPDVYAQLQWRFLKEYFAAFHHGILALILAASRSTEQTKPL